MHSKHVRFVLDESDYREAYEYEQGCHCKDIRPHCIHWWDERCYDHGYIWK